MDQTGDASESKAVIVIRMTYQNTALATKLFQLGQSLKDKRIPDPLFLKLRPHRNRTEPMPA